MSRDEITDWPDWLTFTTCFLFGATVEDVFPSHRSPGVAVAIFVVSIAAMYGLTVLVRLISWSRS